MPASPTEQNSVISSRRAGRAGRPADDRAQVAQRARAAWARTIGGSYAPACAGESVAIRAAAAGRSSPNSARPRCLKPTALTCVPGARSAAASTGARGWWRGSPRPGRGPPRPRSTPRAPARPARPRTRAANDSRARRRTAEDRHRAQRAHGGRGPDLRPRLRPEPITPSVAASGRASASTAAPPIAPVRREPISSPTAIARIRPVRASCSTTSCSPYGVPERVVRAEAVPLVGQVPGGHHQPPALERGGRARRRDQACRRARRRSASRIAATAVGASSRRRPRCR